MKQPKYDGSNERHGSSCTRCRGLSWRRPLTRPCKCGEAFAPEEIKRVEFGGFSPLALASMNDEARVIR